MKSLSKRRILKKEFIQNIFTERDILNHLYNAHIVNLYATFQDENNLYMIIDYMQGGDLRKLMSKKILEMKVNIKVIFPIYKSMDLIFNIGVSFLHHFPI